MKVSARNVLRGKIKSVKKGAVNAEVTIEVARGVDVVSIITLASVKSLGLKKGTEAFAIIKASNVMIGTPHGKGGKED